MNVILGRQPSDHACGGLANGRFLFLVPWREVSILGTSHDAHDGATGRRCSVTRCGPRSVSRRAREAFPQRRPDRRPTSGWCTAGCCRWLPGQGSHVKLLRESAVVDHRRDGTRRADLDVRRALHDSARHRRPGRRRRLPASLGHARRRRAARTETPVEGGAFGDKESFLQAALRDDATDVSHATCSPASGPDLRHDYDQVLRTCDERAELAQSSGRGTARSPAPRSFTPCDDESAVQLSDALIRRTEAGSAGHPGSDAIERAADAHGRELRWDETRRARARSRRSKRSTHPGRAVDRQLPLPVSSSTVRVELRAKVLSRTSARTPSAETACARGSRGRRRAPRPGA